MLLAAFGLVMLAAARSIWRRSERDEPDPGSEAEACPPLRLPRDALAGVAVGFVTGFPGVGGGFLIVPTLAVGLAFTMRTAVGTSLAIITATSADTFAVHPAAGRRRVTLNGVIRVAHTSELEPALLDDVYAMLVEVFDGDIEDSDWEHALGGIHALAYDDGELVGHASVIQRRLIHDGRALRTGYVEAVGVRAHARRNGHASALMDAIEHVIRGAYEIGALGASDMALAFYRGRGWLPWEGETYALAPDGRVRTPEDDDSLHVLEITARLDRAGEIACDWREGAVW